MTTTLSDWLLAQIAGDEAVAREARPDADEHWLYDLDAKGGAEFRHIARWDPAHVLADCEAKRRIVGLHAQTPDPAGDPMGDLCAACRESGPNAQGWPCDTLRLLALPYADRTGYREEWRP